MSPTRRDVLLVALGAPALVLIPATTPVPTAKTKTTAELYLSAYAEVENTLDRSRVGNDFELYVDDRKAIFRVAEYDGNEFRAWHELVFVDPTQMHVVLRIGELMKERHG